MKCVIITMMITETNVIVYWGFCEVQMIICIASDCNSKLQDRYYCYQEVLFLF